MPIHQHLSKPETWYSPEGVEHLQPETGNCFTCGRRHDVTHFRIVRHRGEMPQRCATRISPRWPYECVAKDKHPEDTVYICDTHNTWWHER